MIARTARPRHLLHRLAWAVGLIALASLGLRAADDPPPLERIAVSDDGHGFLARPSGARFVPWGFNYDHDREGRLLEDYWRDEWPMVEADFAEMRDLGANVVRVHLQVGRLLVAPDRANEAELERLDALLALAERTGLRLDLTGLGCYHKSDVPEWYDRLDEEARWRAQETFWRAVAKRGSRSSAVFCYDLMNEPVVPGKGPRRDDWLGPAFAGKHFVQFITLELGERERADVARAWTRRLARAVRSEDSERLITVGLVPWSLDRPGLTSGFVPAAVAPELDFVAVHIYPESGKLDEALETLRGFDVGKPLVIEEIFPLRCSAEELRSFLLDSRSIASGWIGFYWGETADELRQGGTIRDAIVLSWLELFRSSRDTMTSPKPATPPEKEPETQPEKEPSSAER